MDIKEQLKLLKEKLEKKFETETTDRQKARERTLNKILMVIKEFDNLSQKTGTTVEQMATISELKKIMFKLGDIKSQKG